MTKREERLREVQAEAQQLREQAEAMAITSRWDLDPVKQFVRRRGWLQVIRNYVRRRHQAGVNSPLKYLTLPGPNASDIGFFWKERMLQQREDGKLNVAICDRDFAERVAAILGELGGPLAYSNRLLHLELADPNGVLNDHFPFDVINLDMCDCLIPPRAERGLRTIQWIFRLQKGQGFLLLLTTKPDPAASGRLLRVIAENLQNEELFRGTYIEHYGAADPNLCLADYTLFTQIVFPKVVARFARACGYKATEHFAANYRRQDERSDIEYDMVCHSFEFDPIGLRKASSKYKARFAEVPRSDIDEIVNDQVPSRTRIKAEREYGAFVRELPRRIPTRVSDILQQDPNQEARLDREAKSLHLWWEAIGTRRRRTNATR